MLFYAKTDPGRVRDHNEDYVFASDAPLGDLPNLYIVADGMGGHNAGEHASEIAVKTVVSKLRDLKGDDVKQSLRLAISAANEAVIMGAIEDPTKQGMGTTLVVCVVGRDEVTVANVGDSRAYIVRNGRLERVTHDHSVIEEMIRAGTLSKSAAAYHPDKHKITRAIGAEDTVKPDIFTVPVEDLDAVLLCTDGLTNMVEDDEIEEVLTSGRKVKQQAEELLNRANDYGGRDNITLLVIDPVNEQ